MMKYRDLTRSTQADFVVAQPSSVGTSAYRHADDYANHKAAGREDLLSPRCLFIS